MAKQDEVEPAGGSEAAEPSDAIHEVTADQPGDGETVEELDSADPDDQPGEDAKVAGLVRC